MHKTFPFSRPMRLSGKLAFAAVYERGGSRTRGPIKLFALPNELEAARLGLSVSRRVGVAPKRNRIKRLLRESFRSLDPQERGRYDFIVVVRPHPPLELSEYQTILRDLIGRARQELMRRELQARQQGERQGD